MPLLETILGGGVGRLVKEVVGSFKLDPAVKAQIDAEVDARAHELAKIDREFEARLLDAQTKEAEIASANIRAEAAADSWMSKNSRPFFLFSGAVTIMANIWIPLISHLTSRPIQPLELGEWFYGTFTLGFGGYTYSRMTEKIERLRVKR
jgi:hypothetical protein